MRMKSFLFFPSRFPRKMQQEWGENLENTREPNISVSSPWDSLVDVSVLATKQTKTRQSSATNFIPVSSEGVSAPTLGTGDKPAPGKALPEMPQGRRDTNPTRVRESSDLTHLIPGDGGDNSCSHHSQPNLGVTFFPTAKPQREHTQPPKTHQRGGWSSTAHTPPAFHTHTSFSAPVSQLERVGIYTTTHGQLSTLYLLPFFILDFYFFLYYNFFFFSRETGCPGAASPWKLGDFSDTQWGSAGTERLVQEY